MARRKLTDEKAMEMFKAYDQWGKFDPDSESATEFARQWGLAKPSLYNYLKDRAKIEARVHRARNGNSPAPEGAELEPVVRYLTDELFRARLRIQELEAQLASEEG